jgi:hypothetical protein
MDRAAANDFLARACHPQQARLMFPRDVAHDFGSSLSQSRRCSMERRLAR